MNFQRKLFLFIILYCLVMMTTAVGYFQTYLGLHPCVLCVAQRVVVISIMLVALLGLIVGRGQRIFSVLLALIAGMGIFLAGRHVWIQSLPIDQVPACGPDFDYIVDVLPLGKALQMIMMGDGNCADVVWSFLGLSIPGWTLVAFIGLAILSFIGMFKRIK